MKKHLCWTICLVLLSSATALAAMDLGQGFLGFEWGQDVTQKEGFVLKHTGGIIDYYVDESTNYNISEVDAAQVVFGTIDGKLYAVFVNLATEKGYVRAKDYMLSRFGNPKVKQQGKVLEYSWLKYDFTVRIKLKKNEETGKMKMAFYYLPMAGGGPDLSESEDRLPSFKWSEKRGVPREIPLLSF